MPTESNPQLVLCNGARLTSRKQVWTASVPLELASGADGNVHIKIREIAQQLTTSIDPIPADLLEVAAFVYVADQAIKRTGKKRVDYGDDWYRDFRFEIAVREPDFWNQEVIRDALTDTLDFLSGDRFEFAFSKNRSPTPFPTYLQYGAQDPNPEGVKRVVMFSGGLDSLAGAIEEVFKHQRRVVLVSHKPVGHVAARQKALAQAIRNCIADPGLQPLHVAVTANKKGQLDSEHTQRSRSFLYVTMGAVVATLFGLDEVCFYENGIMSVNLPLAGHELGGRASRTTHPQALVGFEHILSKVFGRSMRVPNGYFELTKQDVVERLKQLGHAALAGDTVSCMHTRETTQAQPHCGMCVQCICRRLATLGAGCQSNDPDSLYRGDVLLAARKTTEHRTAAERFIGLAHEIESMQSADEFGQRYALDVSRLTPYLPGSKATVVDRLFDLHHRHAEQVGAVLTAAMKSHVDDYYHKRLEPTCALMSAFSLGQASAPRMRPAADDSSEGSDFVPSKNEVLVLQALDGAKQLMQQVDLETATDALGTPLSRRTIGPILQRLEERKLVEYPKGTRSGAQITAAGRALINRCDPSR